MRAIPLTHLISGVDADPAGADTGAVGATLAAIAGYTEMDQPHVSGAFAGLGNWILESSDRYLRYLRTGEPRSNIMLLDHHGRDLGPTPTAMALALLVDDFNWQETVAVFVRARYA